MDLYSASLQTCLRCATQLLLVSRRCKTKDMGCCITRCACLLSQLLPGTHCSLPQRMGFGWVGLGAWFCAIQRRSPTQALTGPSIEYLYWSIGTCYRYTKSAANLLNADLLLIRSTSKSRPNNIRGKKCLPVRPSVRPSVHKKFLQFEWKLVYR